MGAESHQSRAELLFNQRDERQAVGALLRRKIKVSIEFLKNPTDFLLSENKRLVPEGLTRSCDDLLNVKDRSQEEDEWKQLESLLIGAEPSSLHYP